MAKDMTIEERIKEINVSDDEVERKIEAIRVKRVAM
jgi:hypothetical protein